MANPSSAGATPANVAAMATQSGALRRTGLSLIGVFGQEADLQALVREPNGKVHRVANGTKLSAGRIVGIDTQGVVLQKNGRTVHLTLP
ncbi:MAG: ribosomal protein L2 [Paracoccaceae bacterium]|jgi:ribosomal protein L2